MARFHFNPVGVALFISVCLLVPSISAEFKNVTYCAKTKSYPVKVCGVDINPYPVTSGKDATFRISASTDKPITGGKLVIEVKYFGIHVRTENHDLCTETSCPVAEGKFVIAHSQQLPVYTPPGSYTLKMTLSDGKKELTCINFNFAIKLLASDAVADS